MEGPLASNQMHESSSLSGSAFDFVAQFRQRRSLLSSRLRVRFSPKSLEWLILGWVLTSEAERLQNGSILNLYGESARKTIHSAP